MRPRVTKVVYNCSFNVTLVGQQKSYEWTFALKYICGYSLTHALSHAGHRCKGGVAERAWTQFQFWFCHHDIRRNCHRRQLNYAGSASIHLSYSRLANLQSSNQLIESIYNLLPCAVFRNWTSVSACYGRASSDRLPAWKACSLADIQKLSKPAYIPSKQQVISQWTGATRH